MLKTLRQRPETVFALVLLWKAALLLFTAQPIPANDSFFYDGAVVNYRIHGKYCNPAIANALPISGNEIFSAYPPLYQLVLLGWMTAFGTSVLSAMGLHFVLFAAYAVLVLATLRELRVPVWTARFAGLFLLGITFHDRPDSLAHVFGMAAVFAAARAFRPSSSFSISSPNVDAAVSRTRTKDENEDKLCSPGSAKGWSLLTALSVLLCLGTSLQIGGIYFLLIWLAMLQMSWLRGLRPAWAVLAAMTLVPVVLVLGVKLLWPHLWAGFQEHAQQTPTLTSWRIPNVMEMLKIIRVAPGALLVLVLSPCLFVRRRADVIQTPDARQLAFLLAASVAAFAVLGLALFFLAANLVLIAAYLQPLIVGSFLGLLGNAAASRIRLAGVKFFIGLSVLLVSIRAIGLSTIGVACAQDVSRGQALAVVARELAAAPTNAPVALASAYLYDAWPEARRLILLHSDWLGPAAKNQPDAEVNALYAVKPSRLILTQFDYYRRYAPVLARLGAAGGVSVQVENLARVRPPDATPRWQRVVQHVSWAPVIVRLDWAISKP